MCGIYLQLINTFYDLAHVRAQHTSKRHYHAHYNQHYKTFGYKNYLNMVLVELIMRKSGNVCRNVIIKLNTIT